MGALRVVGFNVLLLLAGCALLELAFGSWLVDRRIRNLNLISDRLLVRDASPLYDNGGEAIVYLRDVHALRGQYPAPDEIDILTVGGSTTDQKYLSEGATWQDVLAENFHRAGRALSVVNAGVDGHSTLGHLRSFRWWFPSIPGFAPKYVLFYVGINDVHLVGDTDYDQLVEPDGELGLIEGLKERSALYAVYRTLNGIREAERRGVGHRRIEFTQVRWVDRPVRERHAERSAVRRRSYAKRLHSLAAEARKLGAEPIFVTQLMRSWKPMAGRIVGTAGTDAANGVDMYTITSLFNETTLDVCRAERAICIDLARDLQDAFVDADFYDYVHCTPSGARKIGDYLYEGLRDAIEP